MPILRLASTLLGAILFVTAPAAQGGVLFENWSIMKMAGSKVGYVHTLSERVKEGDRSLIRTTVDTQMKMKRLGAAMEVKVFVVNYEDKDGKFVRLETTTDMSNNRSKTKVLFEGNTAKLITELMGRTRERELEIDESVVGPYQLQIMAANKGFAAGTKWKAMTFVPDVNSETEVSNHVIGSEVVELDDGTKVMLHKMEVEMDAMPGMTVTNWVDDRGVALKSVVPAAGLKIETITSTKERALGAASGNVTLSPDVFEKTLVVSREFLPSRYPEAAVIKVIPRDKSKTVTLPSGARQRLADAASDGSFEITLRRYVPQPGKTGTRPLQVVPKEIEASLASNTMIQSDEKEIQRLANDIVGDETDAWAAAKKLERWVLENLTEKSMDVGFASALEVCRDRAGDCSEHAVLLAALCRAAGIPANVSMGLLHLGGVWGGHAWNEVWIDGEWYPLDATLGLGFVDPLHLTMSSAPLADGEMAKEFTNLMTALGNIDIRVQELTVDGKTMKVADAVTVEGQKYTNRLWGFSCEAPAGFEHEPERPRARIEFEVLEIEGKNSAGKTCEIGINVLDLPADFAWTDTVERISRGAEKSVRKLMVDGREARVLDGSRGSRAFLAAVVRANRAMFVFELDRVDGDADRKMFEAFLGSVDFDVAR